MSDRIIERIQIKVGGKEINLSPYECQQLLRELNEMFGERPYPYWPKVIPNWPPQPYEITVTNKCQT